MDQISEPLKADSSPQMCFVCWHYVGSHKFSILTSFLNCFLAECVHAKLFQSCPTLCNSMDYSLLGSSVRGILQARILEWVVTPSFRESFQPRDRTCISYVFCTGRWVLLALVPASLTGHNLTGTQPPSYPLGTVSTFL